jgi:hypothetical protein
VEIRISHPQKQDEVGEKKRKKRRNRSQDESSGNSDDNNNYADIISKECTGNTCHLQLHVGNCN